MNWPGWIRWPLLFFLLHCAFLVHAGKDAGKIKFSAPVEFESMPRKLFYFKKDRVRIHMSLSVDIHSFSILPGFI